MRRLFLLLLLFGSAIFIQAVGFSGLSITFANADEQQQPTIATDNEVPLPGGCGNVTPPGAVPPVCCISGYVYLDGKPIAGAKIIIQETKTAFRRMSAVQTEKHTDATLPYYRLDVTAKPLAISVGDTVWISVEYGDYKRTFFYKVKPGGQQFDIVLPKSTTSTYQFDHQIEAAPPDPLLFNNPTGVATDSGGNIYVLDKENARVVVFDAQGNPLRQWGRFGSGPGQFRTPSAIAVDKWNSYVYVADYIPRGYGNTPLIPRLQKFTLSGLLLGQVDNRMTPPPLPATLNRMVVDDRENIYLAGDNTIRKIDFTGHIAKEWGGSGSGDGQFNKASGLAIDFNQDSTTDGVLYVVDSGNQRVQKFTLDGGFLGQWGSQGNGDGQFSNPQGIAVDTGKDVYVVDSGNQRLQKFNSAGSFLARWGGLKDPTTIVGSNDSVYVADTGNHRIQQFSSGGQLLNTWGQLGVPDCAFNPWSMAVNSQGVLSVLNGYDVSSRPNRCISRFQHGDQLESWPIPEMYNTITTDVHDNLYGVLSIRDGLYQVRKYNSNGASQFTVEIANRVGLVTGIAVDGNGTIYISGTGTGSAPYQIDKLDSTGNWQTAWTNYGGTNFDRISDLTVDKANNLYVAQVYKNVLKLDSTGALKGTFANDAELAYILSIAVAANNHLFVADTGGTYRLQELDETDQLVNKWNLSVYEPNHSDIYTPTVVLVDNSSNTEQVYVIGNGGGTFWDDGILKVYRSMTFTLPIATINHSSHIDVVPQNETLVIDGMGDVSEDTARIVAYRWESDRDGTLGNVATLQKPASQLAAGKHRITFSVQDNRGRWSAPVSFQISVTSATSPTPTPPGQANWTMLLYLDGDYNDGSQLFRRFTGMIQRLKGMNLPAKVNVAIQVDGPQTGDTQRIIITHDNQGNTITETEDVNPNKESAMDHPDTLTDFVRWGQGRFQNSRYYLAIADHGQAVRGIAWDATSDIRDNGVADLTAYLTVKQVGQALRKADLKPVDILHLDACSMNLLETADELKDVAGILVSSQYLAWDYFSYPTYIAGIRENTLPSDLAPQIVNTYAKIVGDDLHPYTISALNLRRVDEANSALSALVTEIQQSAQVTATLLNTIRSATQTFDSDGNYQNTPADLYVDLVHWLQVLHKQVEADSVRSKIDVLLSVLTGADPLILGNRAQANNLNGIEVKLQEANGLSIFYPLDKSNTAFTQYTSNQLFTFTENSQWPNFLIAHAPLTAPGGTNAPLPVPSPMLDSDKRVFLPLIQR